MSRTTGFILSAGLATLVLVCAASTSAQDPDPGETIMLKSCQGCHDLRVIQTSALDAEGWTRLISDKTEHKDVVVSKEDMPVLVKYLTRYHGPVPDGPGKEILLNTCTMCHDLGRIKTGRRSAEEWEETLSSMLNEGAPLSDAQFPVIHQYLSRHYGVE